MVVLTGDIHSAWANDLPLAGYVSSTGANSAGVEFVATSITSQGSPIGASAVVQLFNPHVKYVNMTDHGYCVLDLNKTRAQSDYYMVSTITSHTYTTSVDGSWYTLDGTHHLQQAAGPAPAGVYPPLAPMLNMLSAVNDPEDNVMVLAAFPNPFYEQVVIQYYTYKAEDMTLTVTDMNGKVWLSSALGKSSKGLNYAHFNGSSLANGLYVVTLRGKSSSISQRLLKVE